MLHEIELVGHLGADPVLSYTANTSTTATTVCIAATRRYTTANGEPREETAWFSVALYVHSTKKLSLLTYQI